MRTILNTKNITQPLIAYPFICAIYTSLVITLINLAGRMSFFILPKIGKIYIGVDFFLVPALFFVQNIVTEVYGYERCRQLNQVSILGVFIFLSYSQISALLPIPQHIANQEAFNIVISTYSRHIFAFLFALYFGAIANQYLISKLKVTWKGKFLWARSISATFVGDFIYQVVGSLISRYGILNIHDILSYDLLSYTYKILFEILSIPLVYAISFYLKNLENMDIYDTTVDYNPFKLRI